MRLTLLGSGNAAGMPVYGCDCTRCTLVSENDELRRRSACALLKVDGKNYLLDAGLMNIGDQYPAGTLSGIFLTHFHADHVQGLFHLRWGKNSKIPVYCPPDSQGCDDLYKHPGILDFKMVRKFESIKLNILHITPLPLNHSRVTFGYLFEYRNQRIAYLTDTKGLPPQTFSYLEANPLDVLVIDTSFPPGIEKTGHNDLYETLAIRKRVNAKHTVLTHVGHDLDIWLSEHNNQLPASVEAGYDGLVVFSN